MKMRCIAVTSSDLADVRKEIAQVQDLVDAAASSLAVQAKSLAPSKTGSLVSGIISSPWEENSKHPGKIVRQVFIDHKMNAVFVKVTKSGQRYYYPASQEYGFRVSNRIVTTGNSSGNTATQDRVPGKYFMRDAHVAYAPIFHSQVKALVKKVVS